MDENGGSKITSIRQIVKLKEILKKWQVVALSPRSSSATSRYGGVSPEISWRLRNVHCDSDEDSCQSAEMPSDVPRGYLAVYAGWEPRRFIIPTSYLTDKLFEKLLNKVEEEYGFEHTGVLTIPCDTETFKYLLQTMENRRRDQAHNRPAPESSSSSSL